MADVRILDSLAAAVHLAALRDAKTHPDQFQRHARVLGSLLAVDAIHDMPTEPIEVTTPLGTTAPSRRPAQPVVAVPVLRAGLGLLPGVQDVLPFVAVGMVGLERHEDTHEPTEYYRKLPDLAGAWILMLEPMLATGGSAAAAIEALGEAGAAKCVVLSVVATGVAVDRITAAHPDVRIVTGAIDPELDENAYIVPGLGDFGDRLFGTPHA